MILFVARNPPNPAGPGGSQRAMHLLNAVVRHGPTDFLLLHRDEDVESAKDTLAAVKPLVASCRRLEIDEWAPSWRRWPRLSWQAGQIAEALTLRTIDAPSFSRSALKAIARSLPRRDYDLVFASRLSSAWIANGLIRHGHLRAERRIVDLDDRLAAYKRRTFALRAAGEGRLRRVLQRAEMRALERAEIETVRTWDAAGLANELDAVGLSRESGRTIETVPNVVERPLLPPPSAVGSFQLLFVGHLSYDPNFNGLMRFLTAVWPAIQRDIPECRLDVVGMRPKPELAAVVRAAGATLHADVPAVEPFYARCDCVVVPIWEGGGTRIKILEAMAYGRPVVSTPVGAEGLPIVSGVTGMIADDDRGFAEAVVTLARNPDLCRAIVTRARQVQVERFSRATLEAAVDRMIGWPSALR